MTNHDLGEPTWKQIGIHLSLSLNYREWRKAPWLHGVIGDGGAPARVRAYEIIEKQHIQELEQAVEQWLSDASLPNLAHPASYFLALRFSTVGYFLLSLDGFFPSPQESDVSKIYRRFLIDWWRKHGSLYAVGYSCSEFEFDA